MGIKICWHGCASFSLRMYGQEFLFDPFFSPAGQGVPARPPNDHAPSPADYLRAHWPDLCLITGGRYDHCDVETIRRLGMMRPQLRFLGGDEVVRVLRRTCALADTCVWPAEVGDVYHMGTVRVETLSGRPGPGGGGPGDGSGAPRVGTGPGPTSPTAARGALSFRLAADLDLVYVSGDATLSAVPQIEATIAVLCVGAPCAPDALGPASTADREAEPHGEPHPAILDESDLVAAARRLAARVLVPIHWDYPGFAAGVDIRALQRRLAERMPAVAVVVPPYNEWIEVET